jgi:uncharacterized protein YydD (DUF2326 family)
MDAVERPAISSPRESLFLATILVHDGVTKGERIMTAQRVWKPVRAVKGNAEIEQLRLKLASFNERIEELENQHPEAAEIDALKGSALALARQIDEIRCSNADDLTDLLTN